MDFLIALEMEAYAIHAGFATLECFGSKSHARFIALDVHAPMSVTACFDKVLTLILAVLIPRSVFEGSLKHS